MCTVLNSVCLVENAKTCKFFILFHSIQKKFLICDARLRPRGLALESSKFRLITLSPQFTNQMFDDLNPKSGFVLLRSKAAHNIIIISDVSYTFDIYTFDGHFNADS